MKYFLFSLFLAVTISAAETQIETWTLEGGDVVPQDENEVLLKQRGLATSGTAALLEVPFTVTATLQLNVQRGTPWPTRQI